MASTSTSTALIHHFRSRRCCFKHLEPVRTQLNSVKINSSWKGAGLRFIASRNGNGFNRAVCFAAFDDDLRDKPPELGNTSRSGGASSALEDRPAYWVLTPAALNFFVNYAEGVVESLWSIDQYFEFVLVLMFSTGLSFQVPVIQLLLGQVGLVSGDQMLSIWRYVVVGAVVAAAVLTPSTDPLTQILLAAPLLGLYLGGAWVVKLTGR
ncbi:sec-independent protein translocase protein TATC, chloroplastic [Carica papaya]|uniref:sec-independent protein translocase protein TATC, chloroplastic n=1 Tax=Carica papaya TaxID=3649 RepID=UPI000B8C9848|nr:sec-independent protein translocase protein TATC, chloroplastic [Carica papaya]